MAMPSRRQSPRLPSVRLARDVLAMSLHADPQADADAGEPAAPEWVHLLPTGTFSGRDGRGPYSLDAEAVLAAFAEHGADLPIDYEHQSLKATAKTGPAPAAGWIKQLEMRADGLWARVEWTAQAAALLIERAYRYLSPVFLHDRAGTVLALSGAGLTHNPNLHLRAAASAHQPESHAVDELMERLIYMLNLPVTSTGEDVAAELQKLIDRLQTAEQAVQAAQSATPDPALWVPIAQHQAVAETLTTLQTQMANEKASAAVAAAMRAGKLAPAMQDWATGYAGKDPDGFAAWVAAAPVVVTPEGETANHRAAPADDALNEEDRYVCAALGMAEADFAAHKRQLAH